MDILMEAYLQEYTRREMIQGLEAKRLAKSAQNSRQHSRFSISCKIGYPFQLLNERIRAFVGTLKTA